MFGCLSRAAIRASRLSRSTKLGSASPSRSTFSATGRPSDVSIALTTTAIEPRAISWMTSYLPIFLTVGSAARIQMPLCAFVGGGVGRWCSWNVSGSTSSPRHSGQRRPPAGRSGYVCLHVRQINVVGPCVRTTSTNSSYVR